MLAKRASMQRAPVKLTAKHDVTAKWRDVRQRNVGNRTSNTVPWDLPLAICSCLFQVEQEDSKSEKQASKDPSQAGAHETPLGAKVLRN